MDGLDGHKTNSASLGDSFVSYRTVLEMCGLETLYDRRQKRCPNFALKCTEHPKNKRLLSQPSFNPNPNLN